MSKLKKIGIGVAAVFGILIVLGIIGATFTPTGKVSELQSMEAEDISLTQTTSTQSQESVITKAEQCKKCSDSYLYGKLCRYEEDCLYNLANTVEDCKSYKQLPYLSQGGRRDVMFDENYVEKCILEVAVRLNNTQFCDELSRGNKFNCYLRIALNSNNPKICNGLEEKFECLRQYMVRKDLPDLCRDETEDPFLKNRFLFIESCILSRLEIDLSELEKGISACLEIFDEEYEKFSPKVERDECIAIIGINQKSLDICDKSGERRAECYWVLAKEYDFVTLNDCDKLGTNYQGCYRIIAIRTGDASICSELSEDSKDACIREVAWETNDISLCLQVTDKYYCANKIDDAIKPNYTLSFCEVLSEIPNMNNFGGVDQCFYTVATKELNLSACDRISSSISKNECKTVVEHALSH